MLSETPTLGCGDRDFKVTTILSMLTGYGGSGTLCGVLVRLVWESRLMIAGTRVAAL